MSDDTCENNCVLPVRFPRRPGENQPSAHGADCSCSAPEARISSDNRPALPHFNYRIGTYATIREWLLHQINQTPNLRNWTHRTPDDPAIALLEGASILGDILTFYQETYANEAFLRTAQWRESISDLVRLLGYRLSPAVGGKAIFAFELKKDEPIVIPVGFPVKATLEKFEKPVDFETTEEIIAYPWLGRFNLFRPLYTPDITHSTNEFYISSPDQYLTPMGLKAGDRLLIGEVIGNAAIGQQTPQDIISAAEQASVAILECFGASLNDAQGASDLAAVSEAGTSEIISLAGSAVTIAAGEAAMESVDEAIYELGNVVGYNTVDAGTALHKANVSTDAAEKARETVKTMVNTIFNKVGSAGFAWGVSEPVRRAARESANSAADAAQNAANTAVSLAGHLTGAEKAIKDVISAIGSARGYANTALTSEKASKLADAAAAEAAAKAVRLAAIAASSAAAGASDRVEASALAGEAETLAGAAETKAGLVEPAIDNLHIKANEACQAELIKAAAIAAAVASGGVLAPAAIAATDAANRANGNRDSALTTAKTSAVETVTATNTVKGKTHEVVVALSASATAAATQSITDRTLAVGAAAEADRLALLAKDAAETMVNDRKALVTSLNAVVAASVKTKAAAMAGVAAARALIAAIREIDIEIICEAFAVTTFMEDSAENPNRLKNAEIVIVDSLCTLHGRMMFKIKGSLKRAGGIGELTAFKLSRSFHHFGYNGSPTFTKVSDSITSTATTETSGGITTTTVTAPGISERNTAFSRLLGTVTESADLAIRYPGNTSTTRTVMPPLGKMELPLDFAVEDISPGTTLLIEATLYGSPNTGLSQGVTLVRKISRIKPASLTWGQVTGSTSLVTLDRELSVFEDGIRYRIADIRDFQIHEVSGPMLKVRAGFKVTPALSGAELNFLGTGPQAEALKGRRVLSVKAGADPALFNVGDVQGLPAAFDAHPMLRQITLDRKVSYADYPNERPIVTVFGNLVDADEGKTLPEAILGSGDATQAFQNFILPKAPLTYHIVPENTPCETPEIAIYVDGQEWTRVDSFFGRGEKERIYIVREDAAGNSWVQFGDGKTGARLVSGNNNVTAIYRRGAGAFGPLKEDAKVQAMARLKNLDKVQMPAIVTGGAPPEDGENARLAAPGKVQSLGRIVSLKDFEAEAAAIPGVSSAGAAWQLDGNIPAVVVTVLMETGRGAEFSAVRDTLRNYNTLRGAGRNSIIVHEGKRMYVTASIHYALMPGFRADIVEPEIRRALGVNFALSAGKEARTGLFSLRQRRFGGREYSSTIEGVVQNVPGVLWAETKAFTALTDSDDPTGVALPLTLALEPIVGCDAGHILSLYDGHLFLIAVKAEAT